jgi:exonuclease III
VRIATWNVNSAKQRMPRLLPWLDQRRPDVVCLQETKLADDAFTALFGDELASRGYEVALHGEPQWNGVAILSRVGLDDVVAGLEGGPGFPTRRRGRWPRRAAACASSPCTSPTAGPRTPSTTTTSSRGWPRCATPSPPPGPTRPSSAAT